MARPTSPKVRRELAGIRVVAISGLIGDIAEWRPLRRPRSGTDPRPIFDGINRCRLGPERHAKPGMNRETASLNYFPVIHFYSVSGAAGT